jgi:hypothetical protein
LDSTIIDREGMDACNWIERRERYRRAANPPTRDQSRWLKPADVEGKRRLKKGYGSSAVFRRTIA